MTDFTKLHSVLKDVPLFKTRVCESAQRDLRQSRVDFLASQFDPEMFGYPVVSFRSDHYYIVDGQHRINAVKQWLGKGWEKQSVTCRVYQGMTEQQEAEMFDRLNNVLAVGAFYKFRVRVTAGRPTECAVKKAVENCGLKIAAGKAEGTVSAVSTLVKIYERSDASTLSRGLTIVNNSFGVIGMTNVVIDGVARVCSRYNGELKDGDAVEKLRALRGGVGQLMAKANLLRNQTHQAVPECVAAAVVEIINAKRGGKKLPSWWKET